MGRPFSYIPGALNSRTGKQIPWMTQAFGMGSFRAGVNCRTLGFAAVERNLQRRIMGIRFGSLEGIKSAMEFVHQDMLVTSPTIPKDTGALRESWDVKDATAGANGFIGPILPTVEAGFFDVEYALYVHEMTDDAYSHPINWTTEGSGAKFFEYALKRNIGTITHIVQIDAAKGAGIRP